MLKQWMHSIGVVFMHGQAVPGDCKCANTFLFLLLYNGIYWKIE